MAGPYFVAPASATNPGSDANAGTSWSAPWLTVKKAIESGGASAGDIVVVDAAMSGADADTTSGNLILTSVGTALDPVVLISSTNGTTGTTIAYSPGAEVETTAGGDITLSGKGLVSFGVDFICNDGINLGSNNDALIELHDCTLELNSTVAGDRIRMGIADAIFRLYGVTFKFSNIGQGLEPRGATIVELYDCDIAGSLITDVITKLGTQDGILLTIDNCDFTAMAASGAVIIGAIPTSSQGTATRVTVSNCALTSDGVITDETLTTPGTVFEAFNCGTSSEENNYYFQTTSGVVQNDTNNYLDATNGFSLNMTTTANSKEVYEPLRVLLGEVHASAAATIGVEGMVETTQLQDDEFWIEVVYPKTGALATKMTATTLLSHEDGNACDVGLPDLGTTPSNLATGAGSWTENLTGTSIYFKAEINLAASGSGGNVTNASGAGVVQVWANLAYDGVKTCYVDSKIVVT